MLCVCLVPTMRVPITIGQRGFCHFLSAHEWVLTNGNIVCYIKRLGFFCVDIIGKHKWSGSRATHLFHTKWNLIEVTKGLKKKNVASYKCNRKCFKLSIKEEKLSNKCFFNFFTFHPGQIKSIVN